MSTKQRVDVRGGGSRCPYCRDELEPGKEVVGCADCGARHHAACHQDHGACSACGSTEALYPRAAPDSLQRPLAGSRIRVHEEGDATHLEWPTDRLPLGLKLLIGLLMVLAFYVMIPLWLVHRYQTRSHPKTRRDARGRALQRITLTPRALHVGTTGRRLARERVGRVLVTQNQNVWALTVDHGLERVQLATSHLGPTAPELEWLADRIRAWQTD